MLAACLSFAACPVLAAGSAKLTLSGAPQKARMQSGRTYSVVIAADPAIAAGPAFAASRALATGPACAADLAAN